MENNIPNATLKEIAMGTVTPSTNPNHYASAPETTEYPNQDNNDIMGDAPVIISAPKKQNQTEQMTSLMNTPVPSAIGLDDETLNSPMTNTKFTPMTEAGVESPTYQETAIPTNHMDMLAEIMPDLSIEERLEIAKPFLGTRDSIVKDLILNMGFTREEAAIGADNQLRKKITEAYNEHKNNKEDEIGIVTIDKTTDINSLGLTKEEHMKLEKVKKVRLVVMEDADLANIKIERPNEEHKADYVKSIEGSLSRYAVPMPMLGDFVSFKGAQLVQLVNAVNYEDARIDEVISTKASLIYEKFMGGVVVKKYDYDGKNIMSYNEFANKFAYQDIDMALYGILCASSMEENSTSLTCNYCSHQWVQSYNLKSLLKLDDISTDFKERVDSILRFKSNDIEMRKLYEQKRKASRYKSPFTNNIYDLSYPTIARATNMLKRVDSDDTVMTYLSAIALYLSRVLVYNAEKDSYIEITADETPLLLDAMKTISNEDVNMLAKQVRDEMYYAPQFILHSKCPSCGRESDIPIGIENLIFLIARDSMVEIDS